MTDDKREPPDKKSGEKGEEPKEGGHRVGYGRTPVATRFQPGKSGNPKGRRKGSKNFATLFDEELAQPVTVTENGRRKRIQKRQAVIRQVVNKALTADPKATGVVFEEVLRAEGVNQASGAFAFDRNEDALVIESVIRRIRMAQDPPDSAAEARDAGAGKP